MGIGNEFRHESIQDQVSIVQYLKAIAEGLEKGTLEFQDNKESVQLFPHGLLNFELKARSDDGKAKLTLKISWKESTEPDTNGNLIIKTET